MFVNRIMFGLCNCRKKYTGQHEDLAPWAVQNQLIFFVMVDYDVFYKCLCYIALKQYYAGMTSVCFVRDA